MTKLSSRCVLETGVLSYLPPHRCTVVMPCQPALQPVRGKAAADSGEDRWMALAGASLSPTPLTRQTQELTNTLGNLSLGLTELQAAYSLTRKALALM